MRVLSMIPILEPGYVILLVVWVPPQMVRLPSHRDPFDSWGTQSLHECWVRRRAASPNGRPREPCRHEAARRTRTLRAYGRTLPEYPHRSSPASGTSSSECRGDG